MATKKNKAAVALGRLRWKGKSKEEILLSTKAANTARNKKLTKEQRSAIAKKAAAARWGDKKGKAAAKPKPKEKVA